MKRAVFDPTTGSDEEDSVDSLELAHKRSKVEDKYLEGLDEDQKRAFDYIRNGTNLFMTGSGGCGKTFLLRRIHKWLREHMFKRGAIISTTGVTALLVQGRTFASFFGFGVDKGSPDHMWSIVKNRKYLRKQFKDISLLVIDEVSMLSDSDFECADYVARRFRNNLLQPFGGIQMVLCGDFSQLPPVEGGYIFATELWKSLDLQVAELRGNHRQSSDEKLHTLLNFVRRGEVNTFVKNALMERVGATLNEEIEPSELCSRRIDTEKINLQRLEQLTGEEQLFTAEFQWFNKGSLNPKTMEMREKQTERNIVTPFELRLKIGAQVMLTTNFLKEGLANGSMGVVVDFEDNDDGTVNPVVHFTKKNVRRVMYPHTWKNKDLLDKSELWYKQIPLILAWSITVHRSQGATLDYVKIKLDRSMFCEGMAYVALSRARTLEGIVLTSFSLSAIKTSKQVLDFYKETQLAQQKTILD